MKCNNKKRLVAFLVIVFMLINMLVTDNKVYGGSTIYFTGTTGTELNATINSATSGDTIILTKDVTANTTISIPLGKTITLKDDGNVHRIYQGTYQTGINVGGILNLIGTGNETLVIECYPASTTKPPLILSWSAINVSHGTLNIYNGVAIKNANANATDYNLKRGSYECSAINVESGTLNMYGGVIKNNKSWRYGAIDGSGTFNMYGGVICNNKTYSTDNDLYGTDAGGVRWVGTFNMYNGKIINNASSFLGDQGFYGVHFYGTFNKTGGIISDNYVLTTGLILSGSSTVNVGSSINITATVSPSNVADTSLLWYSSNSSVATVNSSGVVTGVSSGTVTITAVANDGSGVKATKIITVQSLITNITLSGSTTVIKGDTTNIVATITPNTVSNKTLTWTSSNTNVATVETAGLVGIVQGIKIGTTIITATATDGSGVYGSITINVVSDFVNSEAGYILIDEVVDYVTAWTDTENDPLYEEQYRYIHTPTIFKNNIVVDNTMGLLSDNNTWIKTQYKHFSKIGTYTIQYRVKDNPPTANTANFEEYRYYSDYSQNTIYVHRKPIAAYSISSDLITDSSFDLDHSISYSNKGIAKWEWVCVSNTGVISEYTVTDKATCVNSVNSWINSYKPVGYKIVLRVQDIEGSWSEPCIKSATGYSKPIANFSIDKNPMIYENDTQTITDLSYDTNGIGLTLTYSWIVSKDGTNILNSTSNNITSALNTTINSLYPNVTGTYYISLKVTNSAGIASDIVTKGFIVNVNNVAPTVNFDLLSNENPVWTFPKTLGVYTFPYRPLNTLFIDEAAKYSLNINDANIDNTGFIYNWKLERYAVENISDITGATSTGTFNYTTQYPFDNNFSLSWYPCGAYKITLSVTDIPPIPPYSSTDAKTVIVSKNYYLVPKITLSGSFESTNKEVSPGETIKLKATTDLSTTSVNCTFQGTNYSLNKVATDSSSTYWEKNVVIPEDITESGTYYLYFIGKTTYGGNGNVTREIKDTTPIDIIAIKLINFRITNIVNHTDITFPYTKDMLISNLLPYKTGYNVTFQIDSKGKPDFVYGRIDVGNNGTIDQDITMEKVLTGDTETWQGKFYTPSLLPPNTVISIKLDCKKGTTTYNYNEKENWDGRSLITNGTALQDGRINLTN